MGKHSHKPRDIRRYRKKCSYCGKSLMPSVFGCRGCGESGVLLLCHDCLKAWAWNWTTDSWIELLEVKAND